MLQVGKNWFLSEDFINYIVVYEEDLDYIQKIVSDAKRMGKLIDITTERRKPSSIIGLKDGKVLLTSNRVTFLIDKLEKKKTEGVTE